VVREGRNRWQAESGQYLLAFEGSPTDGSLTVLERPREIVDADTYIERGYALHEAGELQQAERTYREGIDACGDDPVLLFNLAVVLEDLERKSDAVGVYERALSADPTLADCHYNLALLYEALAKPRDAIRHMAQYRRMTRKK
jgi:tetratricopeptide (TPR) repeat protein